MATSLIKLRMVCPSTNIIFRIMCSRVSYFLGWIVNEQPHISLASGDRPETARPLRDNRV